MKSMLLVDILARGLTAWPEGLECLSQQKGSGHIINGKGFDGRAFDSLPIADETRIAGAIVTRAEWQAAVDALKAEQAAELKWPDGAEFKGEGSDHFYRNVTRNSFEVWVRSRYQWETIQGVPSYQPLIPRPTERAVEWDGVGLPPVGAICEVKSSALGWVRCEIVFHKTFDDGSRTLAVAWIDSNNLDQSAGLRFRPIRTPEQIAAEEREAAILEMAECMAGYKCVDEPNSKMISLSTHLHDHLYRKQVTK